MTESDPCFFFFSALGIMVCGGVFIYCSWRAIVFVMKLQIILKDFPKKDSEKSKDIYQIFNELKYLKSRIEKLEKKT